MKKILLLSISVLCTSLLFSQKETYINVKGGFTFPVSMNAIGSPRNEVGMTVLKITEDSFSETNPFGSRGAGGTVSASIGHLFVENFGFEFEFSFLRSLKILDASQDRINVNGDRYFAEQHSFTNMFRIAPMLVVMGNKDMKIRPYAKFGVLIPIAGKTIVDVNLDDTTGELADLLLPVIAPDDYDVIIDYMNDNGLNLPIPSFGSIKAKTAGVFSIGFVARIGAEFALTDKLGLFGEMEMNMLTIKAKETRFVEFSAGVPDGFAAIASLIDPDIQTSYSLNDIPEILKLTLYENELTENSNSSLDRNNSSYNRDLPYNQLTFRDNYNSFGFMLGVRYAFGSKQKSTE